MIIYLCPHCGRFGKLAIPEKLSDAACGYCGNEDVDFISRPDIDRANTERDKTEEETLCGIELEVLALMEKAYDIYDETAGEEPNTRHKQSRLASIRLALEKITEQITG